MIEKELWVGGRTTQATSTELSSGRGPAAASPAKTARAAMREDGVKKRILRTLKVELALKV